MFAQIFALCHDVTSSTGVNYPASATICGAVLANTCKAERQDMVFGLMPMLSSQRHVVAEERAEGLIAVAC